MADYIYVVQMDIPPEHEADFNRVYDDEHVPEVLTVPGVHGCSRYVLHNATVEGVARFVAVYDIDSPDVVTSASWLEAIDRGDWKPKIRPHTTNRTLAVYRKIA